MLCQSSVKIQLLFKKEKIIKTIHKLRLLLLVPHTSMFCHLQDFNLSFLQSKDNADLDVCPRDGQNGAGAPGRGADGAQRPAAVDRLHGNDGVAGQEGGEVSLPDGRQHQLSTTVNNDDH